MIIVRMSLERLAGHPRQWYLGIFRFRSDKSLALFRSVSVEMVKAMVGGVQDVLQSILGAARTVAISKISGVPQIIITDNLAGA